MLYQYVDANLHTDIPVIKKFKAYKKKAKELYCSAHIDGNTACISWIKQTYQALLTEIYR